MCTVRRCYYVYGNTGVYARVRVKAPKRSCQYFNLLTSTWLTRQNPIRLARTSICIDSTTMRAGVVATLAVVVGSALYLRAHPTLFASELNTALQFVSTTWELFKPGGKLHPSYFLENQGHTAIEASLVVVIVLLYFQRRFKPKSRSNEPLTEKVCSHAG